MSVPLLVELDNQQWSYLIDGGPLGLDRDTLRRAHRAGRVSVVGSVDLYEELTGGALGDPVKCQQRLELFLDLVGSRILRPLHQRQTMEVSHGGQLPVRKRYLSAPERAVLSRIAGRPHQLRSVAEEAAMEKKRYAAEQEDLRVKVRLAMEEAGLNLTFQNYRYWYETSGQFEDWVESGIAAGVERGQYELPDDVTFDYRRFPSTWLFTTYQLARIVFTVGGLRKILGSDLADAHHVAGGAYYNVLVTDDKALRAATALMPIHPLTVSSSAFNETLCELEK